MGGSGVNSALTFVIPATAPALLRQGNWTPVPRKREPIALRMDPRLRGDDKLTRPSFLILFFVANPILDSYLISTGMLIAAGVALR